jgi:hypothetical protein
MLSSHLLLGLPGGLLGFPAKTLCTSILPHACYVPLPSHPLGMMTRVLCDDEETCSWTLWSFLPVMSYLSEPSVFQPPCSRTRCAHGLSLRERLYSVIPKHLSQGQDAVYSFVTCRRVTLRGFAKLLFVSFVFNNIN